MTNLLECFDAPGEVTLPDMPKRGRPLGVRNGEGQNALFEPKEVKWWHEQIVTWMLLNPHKRLKDCAEHFHTSASYIHRLVNSDAFKAYKNSRVAEFNDEVNKTVLASLKGKLETVAELALDELEDRLLQGDAKTVPTTEVQKAAEFSLRALGYYTPTTQGGPQSIFVQQNTVNINQGQAPQDALKQAQGTLLNQHVEQK